MSTIRKAPRTDREVAVQVKRITMDDETSFDDKSVMKRMRPSAKRRRIRLLGVAKTDAKTNKAQKRTRTEPDAFQDTTKTAVHYCSVRQNGSSSNEGRERGTDAFGAEFKDPIADDCVIDCY
jgi:hypothetical protein